MTALDWVREIAHTVLILDLCAILAWFTVEAFKAVKDDRQ